MHKKTADHDSKRKSSVLTTVWTCWGLLLI